MLPRARCVRARLSSSAALVMLAGLGALALPAPARADLKVRSPIVEWQEVEFEHNGLYTFDKGKSALNGNQSYTFELGYGVTPWWEVELEGETQAISGSNIRLNARTIENTFQLLPQGKYWLDLGLFAEFSNSVIPGEPSELTAGPILQKESPAPFGSATMLHTLNVLFTREVGQGRGSRTGGFVAAQSRLRLHPLFEPGVELYYNVDDLGRPGRFADQELFVGPAFTGAYVLGRFGLPGAVKYEVGYLFGATPQTPRGAVRWRFEYELQF
jgi:hypothetical protein